MSMRSMCRTGALVALMACAMGAVADDRTEYNRRAAARDLNLFHALDRDGNGAVTQPEAQGDVNFLPRFNDMEVNMDGVVTRAELLGYLERQYEVHPSGGRP